MACMALSWRPPNLLLKHPNSFHSLVTRLVTSTIKVNFQFMLFFFLKCVVVGSGANNLIQVFMQALMHEGGITKNLIGKKLMTLSANGVFFFQSIRSSIIRQIFNGWAPHSMGVHYMAHITNVAVQILSHLQMVRRIEGLLQTLYN